MISNKELLELCLEEHYKLTQNTADKHRDVKYAEYTIDLANTLQVYKPEHANVYQPEVEGLEQIIQDLKNEIKDNENKIRNIFNLILKIGGDC